MNVFTHPSFPLAAVRPARRGAFALVITLLILSLLVIVAVSYLSSMMSERQTADAYTAKARAEQAAQSGADSAMAILTESFRDFPDSATAWDTASASSAPFEGTSLYLRAVPSSPTDPAAYANPQPDAASAAANDPAGNNPANPACKTFVLPLISGVPGGRAQLVANRAGMLPAMSLSVTDPTRQNFTDLNVRRAYGDIQGVIGSPPGWKGTAPKPALAYWVTLNGDDNRPTSRYAFWIEDESFRANISYLGTDGQKPGQNRIDNTSQPRENNLPRSLRPGDMSLPGFLTAINDGSVVANTTQLLATRAAYPGGVFPDPLAFVHSAGDGKLSDSLKPVVDALRYLTTTQSGTLNYTRHGTQRLNLNDILPKPTVPLSETPQTAAVTQNAVDQIVETIKFHLPDFGQRFYRTSTATDSATLNARQVAAIAGLSGDPATIYLYKLAANICDYLDTDSQPTMILAGGTVDATPVNYGTAPLNDEQSNNTYWAQGKESSPLIQEVVVRYRPVVGTGPSPPSPLPPQDFDLKVDYYIEFWNMTDRDIYAAPQSGTLKDAPHLNNASVFVRDQQPWTAYAQFTSDHTGGVFMQTVDTQGELLPSNGKPPHDWQIDLSSSAVRGYDPATNDFSTAPGSPYNPPQGVVFRAGAVTVITTDPDCFKDKAIPGYSYKYISPYNSNALANNLDTVHTYPANVFYCPLVAGNGQREYRGHVQVPAGSSSPQDGMVLAGPFYAAGIYSGTEISLANSYGYLDIVRGAITKVKTTATPAINYFSTITWKDIPPNNMGGKNWRNDYSFESALIGNVAETPTAKSATGVVATQTPSELGDPRTNNEQLKINIDPGAYPTANNPDGSHYVPGTPTLGTPNGVTVKPDTTTTGQGWGDYFAMPTGSPFPNPDYTDAPAVIGDGPLTSIGQLGDVYDPARIQGTGGILSSRGGGRTLKIGQHDDRYSFDPAGNPGSYNTKGYTSASTGWASWRLADVFSIDDNVEEPGRLNINGVLRDNGAVLRAALDGWAFQPVTASGATTDPTIHGDGHDPSNSLATLKLTDPASGTDGAAQLIAAIRRRLAPPAPSDPPLGAAIPNGPFLERGEFGELGVAGTPIFGTNPTAGSSGNTYLLDKVDMNTTFDHGREEMFRRLSELICTRGDTFTAYVVGQSIQGLPNPANADPPPIKITGTHRMRVTFRLVPKYANDALVPPPFSASTPDNTIANQVAKRFAKPDHYEAQIVETNTF